MPDRKRIALIAGGWSKEREVSLNGAKAVLKALDGNRYSVEMIDPRQGLAPLVMKAPQIDLAFILLHGVYGEDGCMQGLLNLLGIPFVGSDLLASALAMHKGLAKERYRAAGLKTARDLILNRHETPTYAQVAAQLGAPFVLKPLNEGSSIGVFLCRDETEFAAATRETFPVYDRLMAEEYLPGRELTCCVLGDEELETLPLIEIVPKPGYRFFDYRAKYTPGETREICPAALTHPVAAAARECAKAAHQALGCAIWSRTDMIIRDETVYLLETNTIPGMTENSLFPLAARTAGMSLGALLDRLIALSWQRAQRCRAIPAP